jgi:hypothetical protein
LSKWKLNKKKGSDDMELKLIESSTTPHSGYGAGSGEIIREEYECPCGNGKVIYEKRSHSRI